MFTATKSPLAVIHLARNGGFTTLPISLTEWCDVAAHGCADDWFDDQARTKEPYFITAVEAYRAQYATDQGIDIDQGSASEMFGSDFVTYPVWAWMFSQFQDAFDVRVEQNGSPSVGDQP